MKNGHRAVHLAGRRRRRGEALSSRRKRNKLGEFFSLPARRRVLVVVRDVPDAIDAVDENDVMILGVVRRGKRLPGFAASEELRKGDILVVEASPEAVEQFAGALKLAYSRSAKHTGAPAGTACTSANYGRYLVI